MRLSILQKAMLVGLLLQVTAGMPSVAFADTPLTTATLEIRGAVLTVFPERQEAAPGLPTVVFTALGELDPGQVPSGLRVEGNLSGPGMDEPLTLTTTPGDAFRIPGLNREGIYTLSNIRLVEDGRTISSATPDSVEIYVHRLVISSITSRALTPDEMDAYGIVIDADNYTAWHYSVGFQIEGGTVEVPFDLLLGPQGVTLLDSPNAYQLPVPNPDLPEVPVPTVNTGALEPIPRTGMPEIDKLDQEILESTPIPGFIIIPTDIAFLNQFFSVIMVVQNGALADSGLELRDLTGVLELSSDGLRQAETEPPTIPGQPVPVLDPGPDGETGTSDDLTFIVAQASGQATWLVEGLAEGQHRLTAHLTGEIHGLASGTPAPVEGTIPGVVVVRDPRFAMTFFHPNTVRTGEFYDFRVSVTNTSITPVYDLSLELPSNAISGARLVDPADDLYDDIEEGDNDPVQQVESLLPGTSAMVTWRLESRRTGRVVASAFNSSSPIDASFVFEIGVGELGVPLSPESIVLPPEVDDLPAVVVEPALELLGLAHSLANAPNGSEVDLPPVGETIVMLRGTEIAAAGQRHALGEPVDRAVVGLGLEWMGASHWSSSFDVLRRQSRRGHELEDATAFHLSERMDDIGSSQALRELEELAISGRPMVFVVAEGAGYDGSARLAVVGNTSNHSSIGQRADVEIFSRELEGAAVLGVDASSWSGEIGVISVPVNEDGSWFEGSYQIQLWGTDPGSVDLEVVVVMPDGSTRRFAPSVSVNTGDRSLAFLSVDPVSATTSIQSDVNGDSLQDWWEEINVDLRSTPQATVLAATFNHIINPQRGGPYRNVVLLVSQPVDENAITQVETAGWLVGSELEIAQPGGGFESLTRARHGRSVRLQLDPRILVATFDEPLNPHADLLLSTGASPLPLVSGGELEIVDQQISVGDGLESGVVRGVVLGSDGGPLAHAYVELYEELEICPGAAGCNWYPNLSDRVSADASGAFVFDAVRYRDLSIPSQHAAFTVRAIDPATGHETRLTARLEGDNALRSLTLAMVGRGDVVGTVQKADGTPLDDPSVTARSITDPSEGAQTVPDAFGSFRLEDLPVGPVQVVARDGDSYTLATTQITAPGAEATVDLVLQDFSQPLAQVTGSVIDGETAEPMSGLDVYVTPAGFSGPTHVATTDDEGAFSMADVPPGIATFRAWNPALGRYVGEVVSELLGDATTTVEFVIQPGATGTINGSVSLVSAGSEEPVAGAYVVARNQGLFTLSDDQGHYELTNLPLGRIQLETWDPVTAAATSREVDLTADGQVLVIDFTLREDQGLGSLTVNVANRDGVPEAGADVAIGWFGSSYSGRTGGDGSAWIEDVPPGSHEVLVKVGGRLARGNATVLYPGHAAETNITLGGFANATIRVVGDTTGGGTSTPLTPISYRVPGVTSTGRIGQLPEDGWEVCELEEDFSCRVENLPTNVGSLVAMATSGFYGPVTASKWITDTTEHELIINFEAPGTVGGTVLQTGLGGTEPVDGAIVELWVQSGSGLIPQSQYTTLEDGAFHFELVPLGYYSLRVYHPTYGVQWLDGTVSAGQVIDDLELVLRGRASIEGDVALCFDANHLKAGEQIRITLRPNGVPRPFISDLEIDDFADGVLDVSLDDEERASFMFADRMVGGWTLAATSALHGSAYEPVSLGPSGETTTLAEPLCLHPTGSITGAVSFPETGAPAPSVTVQLFRGNSYHYEYLTTETTGDDGNYVFSSVPVDQNYQVRAYDSASNRGGVSADARLCDTSDPGYGDTCDLEAVLDVSLSPMGRLEGVLRDQYELPVENAHVRLRTSVVLNQTGQVQSYQREWTTFTAADGSFAFDGVPAGTALVTAFDPNSPLFVEDSIAVDPVVSPITAADLHLPSTSEVAVWVVDPLGNEIQGGDPVVAFSQSSHGHFREPSGSSPRVEHLTPGTSPTFAGVVANRYEVGACLGGCTSADVDWILDHRFTTALGAVADRWMSNPPEDQVIELELVGRATVAVTVTQAGETVADASVRITGSGFYGTLDVSTQTGADGTINPIAGIGVGSYTVTASWSGLGGSQEFEIAQEDHETTVNLNVAIEISGSADGRVLDIESNPSSGALVNMIVDGRTFQTISGADGSFLFSALPAGQTYSLEAYAANGLGRHTLHEIPVGTDLVHIGDLVLDETNPWVEATIPINGAQGADPVAEIAIDFSELMRPDSLSHTHVRLREHGTGTVVATTRTIEDLPDPDGEGPLVAFTRVTLSHGPLESEMLYLIDVLEGVEDLAGRSPAFDFHSTFRTEDTIPPEVVGVSPNNDPEGHTPVGPDVVPIISWSESMALDSVDSSTVQLFDAGSQPVVTVLDLQREGFDIRIRPTTALELDSFYTIVVDGVTDAAGIPLIGTYTSTFRVRDIEPPVVTLVAPPEVTVDGDTWTALEGRQITLTALVSSNDALQSVVFRVDGVPITGTPDQTPGYYSAITTMPLGVASVMISATAEDVSANLSATVSHAIQLVDDEPPTGSLSIDHETGILPNHVLGFTVQAEDDYGLSAAHCSATGAVAQEWTIPLSGTQAQDSGQVRVPIDATAGDAITVSCELEDSFGQTTPVTPESVVVLADSSAPVITVIEPGENASVTSGESISFRFDIADDVIALSPSLIIDGESVAVTIAAVELPGTSWSGEVQASWLAPGVSSTQEVSWSFSTTDQSGNVAETEGTFSVKPVVSEFAPIVTFLCPVDGDSCAPGVETSISFHMVDHDGTGQIESYTFSVNGVPGSPVMVNAAEHTGSLQWTTPIDAQPGDLFVLRLEATDVGTEVGITEIELTVPTGTILTVDQSISDYSGVHLVLAGGTFTATDELNPASLTLASGATLTTTQLQPLEIETSGDVRIACDAVIDVTGRGYGYNTTYPGSEMPTSISGGGSHLGEGGISNGTSGETYGSVTRPQESGAGTFNQEYYNGGRTGGGVVRIEAQSLDLKGSSAIRANGSSGSGSHDSGGAGGSIWITADEITGTGVIEASGGTVPSEGTGSGGAIALEYGVLASEIESGLRSIGGQSTDSNLQGAAGSVYLHQTGFSTHGDLVVGNADQSSNRWTVLPSLGGGVALGGSDGVTLVTDRTDTIPAYFVGHWVEVREDNEPLDNPLKGIWRIEGVDGFNVTLEAGATVGVGDLWQGVYRFDSVMAADYGRIKSDDPILTPDVTLTDGGGLSLPEDTAVSTLSLGGGNNSSVIWTPIEATTSVEILGPATTYARTITTPLLTVRAGAILSQAGTGGGSKLTIEADSVVIEDGGSIDVTGRGYGYNTTYPGSEMPTNISGGGSHLGEGGISNGTSGETYGSVTRPQESGAGTFNQEYYNGGRTGGGVVRIEAQSLDLKGSSAIRANGSSGSGSHDSGGAGGSIWITADEITGTGVIEASGGTVPSEGTGSGGAIALEYGVLASEIESGLRAIGGQSTDSNLQGAAGSVYLHQTGFSTHGDLVVGNADQSSNRWTVLPSLGGGVALGGSDGVTLATDRTDTIPAYFVGHWVEVREDNEPLDNPLKGIWRVEAVDGFNVTLEAGATVGVGDLWQGVYRFDSVMAADYGRIKSDDPILTPDVTLTDGGGLSLPEDTAISTLSLGGGNNSSVIWTPIEATTSVEILGPAITYARAITTPLLTVKTGAVLSQAGTGGGERLTIEGDTVVIEDGGSIDVTGRGYGFSTTYPGAELPTSGSGGGSHLGEGGISSGTPGETYGSVTRPQESGAGTYHQSYYGGGRTGGGVVRIEALSLDLQGTASIRANGSGGSNSYYRGGAGGSIWITADEITGTGVIEASGGTVPSEGRGGGGAIALEYGLLASGIESELRATGGQSTDSNRQGAAGSVYLHQTGLSTHGDLVVSNADQSSYRWTVLPSLGGGVTLTGSDGATLVTDRTDTIPAYFVGHWIEVREDNEALDYPLRGIWKVESVDGLSVTLEAGATVGVDDLWQGVYRFDTVTVTGNAKLRIGDLDEIGTVTVDPGASLIRANLGGPSVVPSRVVFEGRDGSYAIAGLADAVTDPEGVASASAVNVTAGGSWPLTVDADGSFPTVSVVGSAGDLIRIDATDGHSVNPRSSSTSIGTLPVNTGAPVIDAGLISYSFDGVSTHATGAAETVSDSNSPVTVTIENTTAGGSWTTTAATDGSFDLMITASCGDLLSLTAVDSHPEPLQATADLGAMPDVREPVIDDNRISIRAHDRAFWANGTLGAVTEECSIGSAYLTDPAQPGVQSPVTVEADGSFADAQIPSTTVGVVPRLTVIDGGGNSDSADLTALPVNDGQPVIDTTRLTKSVSSGSYEISSTGECIYGGDLVPNECLYPFEDADAIDTVRFENRTTPGFDPNGAVVVPEGCAYCPGGRGFRIDSTVVTGAIGDVIWVVVEDGHPQWQSNEAQVWTLAQIPDAPSIDLASINLIYLGGQYRLSASSGAVSDADAPISVEAIAWRETAGEWAEIDRVADSITSAAAFDLLFGAGAEGDLVVLSASDATGRTTARRIGSLPPAVNTTVSLGLGADSIGESANEVSIPVSLSAVSPVAVSVEYRTIAGTATEGVDYDAVSGTISFGPTVTTGEIVVPVTNDSDIEPDETFQVVLENPIGIDLGSISTTEITIFDDDGEPRTVTYSVCVDDGNMLSQPVGLDIVDGVASFVSPLPAGPDRGDAVELDSGTVYFISTWIDDSTFELATVDGLPAPSATGASAVSITPAFSALEAAVDGAADAAHLGTFDLVAANRSLEILCYGGSGDPTPVTIDGWVTSPDHRIRIVAPTASEQRNGNQRHDGRFHGNAYRLTPWNVDALTSTVGNLTIEGLQITNSGYASTPIHMIRLDGIDGDVEILETIIVLDNQANTAERIGVGVTASEAMNLRVRNTIIWDLGDGSATEQVGILTDDPLVTASIVNTTIVGGASGIRSGAGTITAINNLVAGASTACFDGAFTAESEANIATDGTAPGAPDAGISPVTVKGDIAGPGADLHLGCDVWDQAATVSHDAPTQTGEWALDGNADTILISEGVNPASIRLVFDQPRTITGTAIELSNCSSHDWTVTAADSEVELDSQGESYRVLVPLQTLDNTERAYTHIDFAQPETATVFELTVHRLCGGDNVHINEWWLDGVNPACGAGLPMDGGSDGFDVDVDSTIRIGPWDIGADQRSNLSIFHWWGQRDWWEAEGEARVQVMLSEPVTTPVTVRYSTEDAGGVAGSDYIHIEDELVFNPGEVSKIVTIPIIDDGPGDNGEEVRLLLEHAEGANVATDIWSFWTRDDSMPPDRVRLATPYVTVNESDGLATVVAEVDTAPASDLNFGLGTVDGTAHIKDDFVEFGFDIVIPAGQLTGSRSFTIVDDDIAEPDEIFYLRGSWSSYTHDAQVYGIIRIIDDDLPNLAFSEATLSVEETAGAVDVTVEAIGEVADTVTVDVNLGVGTAVEGEDFSFSPMQLVFDAGHSTRRVSIPIIENPEYEPDETIVLELSNPSGAVLGSPASVTVTIQAQEPPASPAVTFSSGVYSFSEPDEEVQFDFHLVVNPPLTEGSAAIDVMLAGGTATNGDDYDFWSETVAIVPSQTEYWLSILGYGDSETEGDETIVLQLANPEGIDIGSPSTATVTIIDDDNPSTVAFAADTLSALESLGYFELQVDLDSPVTGTASVDVAVIGGTAIQDEDFELYDTTLSFSSTTTSQWVEIEALWDQLDETDETIVLQLTNAQGLAIGEPFVATLTILDDDAAPGVPAAQFDDAYLDEGSMTVSETAGIVSLYVLVTPAPTGTASVDVVLTDSWGVDASDFLFNPQTLSFDPSNTSAAAVVEILDDADLESGQGLVFELRNPQGIELRDQAYVEVTIEDDDSVRIDPALVSIDTSGCTPKLLGAANAVTAVEPGINIDVQVLDRNGSSLWNALTLAIGGGEAFEIELPTLDLGGQIDVTAQTVVGGETDFTELTYGDSPPNIDAGALDSGSTPTGAYVNFEGAEAISNRLAEVRLKLLNITAVTEVSVDDPCATPGPSATIAADPADEIQLQACHGVLLELCSSVVIIEGGGP